MHLDFYNSSIGSNGIKYLSDNLKSLTLIVNLKIDLTRNKLGDFAMKYLKSCMLCLTSIESFEIWMAENNIGNEGIILFIEGLISLKSCKYLHAIFDGKFIDNK
jgi:hypothetical protein